MLGKHQRLSNTSCDKVNPFSEIMFHDNAKFVHILETCYPFYQAIPLSSKTYKVVSEPLFCFLALCAGSPS